ESKGDPVAEPAGRADRHRVLLVVPKRFWWPDYEGVMGALAGQSDVEVTVCSSSPGMAQPEEFQRRQGAKDVRVDRVIDEVNGGDYDAIVFLGSSQQIEFADLPGPMEHAKRLIRQARDKNRLVAAICAGPAVLARAGVLEGQKATIHEKRQQALKSGN